MDEVILNKAAKKTHLKFEDMTYCGRPLTKPLDPRYKTGQHKAWATDKIEDVTCGLCLKMNDTRCNICGRPKSAHVNYELLRMTKLGHEYSPNVVKIVKDGN